MFRIQGLLLLLVIGFSSTSMAAKLDYHLHVDIDPENKTLKGRVSITPATELILNIAGLSNVKLDKAAATPANAANKHTVTLKAGVQHTIEYQYALDSASSASSTYSDKNNVVLQGGWYPQIEALANYHLTATLPTGFQVISESEQIEVIKQNGQTTTSQFNFPHVLDQLTLVASNEFQVKHRDLQGIRLETWFKAGNAALADHYLDHAADYFQLYQRLLGPYPYKRFAMVESPIASGHSMPGYTLLGSRVIALPFIVKTSLGHEILHQWFGNSVYVDYRHGNWCEGLTNYLADHYYAEQQQKGAAYRKNILAQYAAYVTDENVFPVRKFSSRHNKSSSAIGYGKVAMIFHQLRQYYGDQDFFNALRQFIKRNQFHKASWHDIQREFEAIDGEPLYEDFNAWLNRDDIASIQIQKPGELEMAKGKLWLKFTLAQAQAYHLHLSLTLDYENGQSQTQQLHFTQNQQDFSIALKQAPISANLDVNYDLMRQLADEEKVPDLAWLLGKKAALIALEDQQQATYLPLINGLRLKDGQIKKAADIDFEQIKQNSIIIAGHDNPLVDQLFARQAAPKHGVEVQVKRHPFNENEIIVLLAAKDKSQAKQAARKLRHYGKYSQLAFENGRIQVKTQSSAAQGISLFKQTGTSVIEPAKTVTLDDIVANMGDSRVLLIGEQHTRFEHHLNQLQLIQKLMNAGHKVAIGMEMFQQPYQSALDDYVAGKSTEAEFLTASQYFQKWRYDYNLYKPIIDYAVSQKLPLLALNIEADVTQQVARKGMHSLDVQKQQQLPEQLDFDTQRYRTDLKSVFESHQNITAGQENRFDYFLQSQTLWDESMAQTASRFLKQNPDHILVILAGNGHLRYRYGIPQRLARLSSLKPVTVVQDDAIETDIADYVLVTRPLKGASTPKIGIYLDMESKDQVIVNDVTEDSVAEKTGIKKGDIILELDNRKLKSFTDLKLALLYADTSKPVKARIKRGEKTLEKIFNFARKTKSHGVFSHGKHK